jgi:hypothetical protein
MDFDTALMLAAVPNPTGPFVVIRGWYSNGDDNHNISEHRFSNFRVHADWADLLTLPVDSESLHLMDGCIYSKAADGRTVDWGRYTLEGDRVIARVNPLYHSGGVDYREVEIGRLVSDAPMPPVVRRNAR